MRFLLEILALDQKLFSGEVDSVSFPTPEGNIQILAHHQPMVVPLIEGELRYDAGGKSQFVALGGGFAEVLGDRVTVFGESAERAEDIDEAEAQKAMERAREQMEKSKGEKVDFEQAAIEYRRTFMRLEVARRHKRRR